MLELKNLSVGYGALVALHGVSLSVQPGSIVTLIGANGAGKTTTLKTISGLLRARGGGIFYDGKDISGLLPHQIVKLGISHVPESRMIFANLTVSENLQMGAYLQKDRAVIRRELDYVFATFPRLQEREQQVAGTLSGGEQQMCAIGRALMSGPKLLLLDEPSAGLAPVVVQSIFEVVKTMSAEGYTVLIVEQNIRQVLKVADRAYLLETGRIKSSGSSKELLGSDEIKKAYLGI
jgi:branched-chain amino acid transport system ATP-binding protein